MGAPTEHPLILLLFRVADRAPPQPPAQTAKELCLTIGGALGPMVTEIKVKIKGVAPVTWYTLGTSTEVDEAKRQGRRSTGEEVQTG